ncbi:hypothetical protein [Leucobacter ruminantium]|uniref:Uncharacterized protein n=1 Tax=Leucobacter ruminantium TaxID=1289170 RepID=A0A939LZJ2_9MICO|nr:hypothetical protein [Leucobacter ruminantium]MBO1805968.1 hypothetical protein [Leucobacter ruminantium]
MASITRALGYKLEIVFENEPDMRPCTIDECVEDEHEWTNGEQFHPCRLQKVEGDGFVVHAHLLDEGWTAWADADDLADAHDGVVQARALAEAFERMQARCDELNGVKLERHTEPGSPAFEAAL